MSPKQSDNKRKRSSSGSPDKKTKKKKHVPRPKPTFPIDKIHTILEQKLPGKIVKPEAAVFLTSILEYLATEIVELTLNAARTSSRSASTSKFTAADMETAIQSDPELTEVIYQARYHGAQKNK